MCNGVIVTHILCFCVRRNNPRGKALMSRVYWLWYFKTNGWRFWAKYLERFGSPLLVGKSNATDQTDMQAFADQLLAAHNSGVFASHHMRGLER